MATTKTIKDIFIEGNGKCSGSLILVLVYSYCGLKFIPITAQSWIII
jgi:hypothetical protein